MERQWTTEFSRFAQQNLYTSELSFSLSLSFWFPWNIGAISKCYVAGIDRLKFMATSHPISSASDRSILKANRPIIIILRMMTEKHTHMHAVSRLFEFITGVRESIRVPQCISFFNSISITKHSPTNYTRTHRMKRERKKIQ